MPEKDMLFAKRIVIANIQGMHPWKCSSCFSWSGSLCCGTVFGQSERYVVDTLNGGATERQDLSRMHRICYVINDADCPAKILDSRLKAKEGEGFRHFDPNGELRSKELIRAVEVSFVAWDVWGDLIGRYRATAIRDLSAGEKLESYVFGVFSATYAETNELLTVVSYISRVRLLGGEIWLADTGEIGSLIRSLGLSLE